MVNRLATETSPYLQQHADIAHLLRQRRRAAFPRQWDLENLGGDPDGGGTADPERLRDGRGFSTFVGEGGDIAGDERYIVAIAAPGGTRLRQSMANLDPVIPQHT